eukprot:4512665-Pyramimonas_sp.AAC.1
MGTSGVLLRPRTGSSGVFSGASWGRLGASHCPIGAPLGAPGALAGPFWRTSIKREGVLYVAPRAREPPTSHCSACIGHSWSALGRTWGRRGALLGPSKGLLGPCWDHCWDVGWSSEAKR